MIYSNQSNSREEVLRLYIEEIYNNYDTQRTGSLNSNNITNFFNELFRSVDVPLVLTPEQSFEAIRAIYPSFTNLITKQELFIVFKALLGMSTPPQSQPNSINMAQYPAMMNNPTFVNPQGFYGNGNMQNYMQAYGQNQNILMAQNMMRQGQNMPANVQQFNASQNNGMNGSRPR